MKRIPLTREYEALVDDEDYDFLMQWKWYLHDGRYAARLTNTRRPGGGYDRQFTLMHRFIISAPADSHVDHRNGDKLDNRRANLRLATPGQNMQNQRKRRAVCTSRYKGVSWQTEKRKWKAVIACDRVSTFIGYFDHEIDAALAYDAKARQLFGEFACTNF